MKILIVDDDQALATVFESSLKKDGFDVSLAYDGRSGLDKAKTEKPDLILLDQVLPDIAGNEVLKIIKEDLETKNIPVSMLSNFGQAALVEEAISRGAIDYILKYQIEPSDLVNKVKALLKEVQSNPNAQTV